MAAADHSNDRHDRGGSRVGRTRIRRSPRTRTPGYWRSRSGGRPRDPLILTGRSPQAEPSVQPK